MKQMRWLKFLIAFLIPMAGVMVCSNSLDNDAWYVLSEGREIVTNGIYYEDQLSMHEGLEVTVQNYGFAAIFYLIYSTFGPIGIYIGMLLLNVLLCYLIYKICMVISNKNENLSLLIMILTDLLLGQWFVVTRAQVVSYCIMMLVIYLLELYIKTDKTKYLWWIPVLSFLQINLHASLWPMIILVLIVYIIDSFRSKKLHLQGYRTKPLLLVLATSFAVGFLNPYGFRMITFIFTSYGVPEAQEYVNELKAFRPLGDNSATLFYVSVVLAMLCYIFGKNQNIRMRWLILIFGFLALGLNTLKGMSQLILVLLFPLAAVYKDFKINKKYRNICIATVSWAGVLAISAIVVAAVVGVSATIDGPNKELIEAIDKIDESVGNGDKKALKIYSDYNNGGFVEYRGYKPYMDPRMEVFIKSNNGKEDIFQEYYYIGSTKDGLSKQEFLDKYNFDYLLVCDYDILFDLEDENYELLHEIKNKDGEAIIRIYKR